MDRNDWLIDGLDRRAAGLEIGPLDRAIMPRPGSAVRYADHLDQAGLRAKYDRHSVVDTGAIPEIDYVIDGAGLGAAVGDQRFAYVIASHVIEHVPNPIAWLGDIHRMLDDGGRLVLAVPDRRRCFDALRRESTEAEWLDAYMLGHSRPSPSRLFDALSNEVKVDGGISWHHDPEPTEFVRSRTREQALKLAQENFASDAYLDVHCWTFVPDSFCNLFRSLVLAGALDFALERITPTMGHEFLVRLVRDDAALRWRRAASFPAAGGRYGLLPAGFDPIGYGLVNPDVAGSGLDPNDHYLQHGRAEGRRWAA